MNRNKIKPLIFAVAAALSPALAQAAVTATQLPGDGSVYSGFGSASATVSGASMSVNILSATSDGNAGNVAIITWGSSGGTLNPNAATGGFDIGSQASVTFTNGTGNTAAPFALNLDTTSNPTEIAGTLVGNDVNLGVANANGIIVDGTAVINAPDGLVLMNQGYSSGDLANFSNGTGLILDFANASNGVTIATGATINADGYVMVAGAGTVNIDAPIDNNGPNINTTHIYATGTLNINAPVTDVGGTAGSFSPIGLVAPVVNVNAPVTVDAPVLGESAGDLGMSAYSLTAPVNGPIMANINISSTGSLTGGNVDIEQGYYGPAQASTASSLINVLDNGSITATNTGGYVYLGGLTYTSGSTQGQVMPGTSFPAGTIFNAIGSVSGSGTIQADNVAFVNQAGSVNDITTGQILANGFRIKDGPSGTVGILIDPGMSSGSGINLSITGNADLTESGQPSAYTGSGSTVTSNLPSDYASKLVVQATGLLIVGNGNGSTYTDPATGQAGTAFNFPGLVYLLGGQGLIVDSAINSAYSTSTPMGFGVFLLGPTVNDTYPIIASGDRGVNIESTQYGPTTINGVAVDSGLPYTVPPIYFFQNPNGTGYQLQDLPTFINEWGQPQEFQTFLVNP